MNDINNLLGIGSEQTKSTIQLQDLIKTPKKKRKSILDEIQQTPLSVEPIPQIVIPQSIAEQTKQQVINTVVEKNIIGDLKNYQEIRKKKYKKEPVVFEKLISEETVVSATPEFIQQNQVIKQQLEQISNVELPDDVNYVIAEAQVFDALENMSDGELINFEDIQITRSDKKDKSGYYKIKTNIGGDKLPEQIKTISSLIIKKTHGLIKPRICDLRLIGNTNKTQLRGSNLKLSSKTIVFKPDFTKLKVNKGTRFMLSIPDDYESKGNLLVYIQESRSKKILEIDRNDFATIDAYNEFICDRISEYYTEGYEVTLNKLEIKTTATSLINVVSQVLKTHEFTAKLYRDDDVLYAVDFMSKDIKNQWLYVQIIEGDIENTYDIICRNNADQTWEAKVNKRPMLIQNLINETYPILVELFSKDWEKELNVSEDDKFIYLFAKLTHAKLKKVLSDMFEIIQDSNEIGLLVKETLSKKDTKFLDKPNESYDAEAIIGKTNHLDYFILTFLAYQIKGGDKRNPQDFIGNDEYNEKYSVKDTSPYESRKRTILKKEGEKRNYNSRPYIFQLEYSIAGKTNVFRTKSFEEIVESTNFLTENPEIIKSKI